LLPQIQEIKGEFKALNARFDASDAKADAFRNKFRAEIKRLDQKIDPNSTRLDEKIENGLKGLNENIQFLQIRHESQPSEDRPENRLFEGS
jgi:hypothetical protein